MSSQNPRPRARDLGIPFDGTTGLLNGITDVEGVCVGNCHISDNLNVNTGVTAILPRGNDPTQDGIDTSVLAAWFSLNGCGEMTGTTWIEESGFLEGVRSRQCQGFPRNPGRFHPGSGLSPSLDQLGAIEREASFL